MYKNKHTKEIASIEYTREVDGITYYGLSNGEQWAYMAFHTNWTLI